MENGGEYFAEGFRTFYSEPRLLKTKAPALYALMAEMTQHIDHLQSR